MVSVVGWLGELARAQRIAPSIQNSLTLSLRVTVIWRVALGLKDLAQNGLRASSYYSQDKTASCIQITRLTNTHSQSCIVRSQMLQGHRSWPTSLEVCLRLLHWQMTNSQVVVALSSVIKQNYSILFIFALTVMAAVPITMYIVLWFSLNPFKNF